ncbi:histidine kinase [Leucobacter sp. CSA1]|uniref:histidine kinase n=1 Tax=Leucobacter chromiisoli TaxID=2796471 RepID=A0A934Q4G6_9MICO|nr:ATP-binding protein [Leucobacter chromiisoli]MBK0417443.1 histidine kinase [Leucobacter chromiisoli]
MRTVRSSRAARLGILLLPCLIVLACVGITASIAISVQERSIRQSTADRVRDVATSLAELAQVREALEGAVGSGDAAHPEGAAGAEDAAGARDAADPAGAADAAASLQPLADVVERAAGVDYLVITDDAGIRITHPTPSERGKPVSTDVSAVLAGEEFLGTETGTLGPMLRAKAPVRGADGEVIGSLSVGILETRIAAEFDEALRTLLPWAIGALVVGTLASSAIAAALERRFRRLDATARELELAQRTATALREQTHEFNTRLHVIHGLVSHGDTAEALSYIDGVAPVLTAGGDEELRDQPLLRATVEALRAELGALGARLETRIDVAREVDEEELLVLANLCRNAGEAGAALVRCELIERGDRLRGTVEDDGPGIDPREAERVFTRGYSSKPDPSGSGRGLGLDLVRRTVAVRGGTVELGRSELGGARFAFEMEVAR